MSNIKLIHLALNGLAVGLLMICCATVLVKAQTKTGAPAQTAPTVPQVRTPLTESTVDETFELKIDERRYTQESFSAATSVANNPDETKVKLQVGVSVTTGRIDLVLRNVHGLVRFRGSLDRLRKAGSASTPTNSERSQSVPD